MTDDAPSASTMMSLRYAGECRECQAVLPEGTWAGYDLSTRPVSAIRLRLRLHGIS